MGLRELAHVNPALVDLARDANILEVAVQGGAKQLKRVTTTEWAGPCPACGGRDRFSVNMKLRVFNCRGFGGGDVIEMVRHVAGLGFGEAIEFITGERETGGERAVRGQFQKSHGETFQPKQLSELGVTKTQSALTTWREGVDLRGALGGMYLGRRGLTLGDDLSHVLRWHPGIGALLALFRNIVTDEPQAISRTFLDGDGRKLERKFLGPVGGAAVMLDAFDTVTHGLHIGEGIETCLAARQLGLRPCWALGSASAIAAFPVLSGVEALTILAEHDEASRRATDACGARWHTAGREVLINRSTVGSDLNDALRGRA